MELLDLMKRVPFIPFIIESTIAIRICCVSTIGVSLLLIFSIKYKLLSSKYQSWYWVKLKKIYIL